MVASAPLVARLAGPIAIAATAAALVSWTWGTWPDVTIDFGRELYVAWRVAEGDTLYRDLAHVQGPLSPWLNGLWFHVFGASLRTLVVANLVALAILSALCYGLLARIGSRFGATIALGVFLAMFAFPRLLVTGNYNFVCPYRQEVTHGVVLVTGAIHGFAVFLRQRSPRALAASGLLLGLAFLGKPEIFAAGLGAVAVGLAATLWRERATWAHAMRMAAWLVAPLAAVVATAVAALGAELSWAEAAQGVFGPWRAAGSSAFASSRVYTRSMGLDLVHARRLLVVCGAWTLCLGPCVVLARHVRPAPGARRGAMIATLCLALGGALVALVPLESWLDALRPLPLFVAALAAAAGVRAVSGRDARPASDVTLLTLTLGTFALLLLPKLLGFARAYHYGFALAMPGTLLLVVALVDWVPSWIARHGGAPATFRLPALVAIALVVAQHLAVARVWITAQEHTVGEGPDAFLADHRGPVVREALAIIAREVGPDETLLVLPEGLMLNYLSRRRNPIPFSELMPTEVAFYGEGAIQDALRAHPPDFVALVHKDTSEYGMRHFGRDYGNGIMAWLRDHYRTVAVVGDPPLVDDRFGIQVLERADRR